MRAVAARANVVAMRSLGAVSLVLVASCLYIAPKEKRRDVSSRIESLPVDTLGPAVPRAWARAVGSRVDITGQWQQTCEQRQVRRTEVKRWRGASLNAWTPCAGSNDGCVFMVVVALVYSPVSLVVSGVYTAVAVAGDDDVVETASIELPPRQYDCSRSAPGLHVRVQTPGRPESTVTLDGDGTASLELGDAAAAAATTVFVTP